IEGAHDSPHGPEKTDIRTGGADRGQGRQALLQAVDLLQLRDAHRAARAFQHRVRGIVGLLAQTRELAEAELEDARHASRTTARLDRAVELGEIATGPELILELL